MDEGRTSVKVHVHDSGSGETTSFVLANLIPGKIESQLLDLIVGEGEELEFEITGKNTVYLSGNLIYQAPPDHDEGSDDEGAFNLEDVSSDVEMRPDEFMDDDEDEDEGRFEEIEEEPVAAPKPDTSKKVTKEKKNTGNVEKSQTSAVKPNKPTGNKPFNNQQLGGKPFGDKPRGDKPGAPSGGAPGQGKKHQNKNKNKNKNH